MPDLAQLSTAYLLPRSQYVEHQVLMGETALALAALDSSLDALLTEIGASRATDNQRVALAQTVGRVKRLVARAIEVHEQARFQVS